MTPSKSSKEQSLVEPSPETPAEDSQSVSRNDLGQFVKGVSGNKVGRPIGSKNRTTVMKQAMEEAITREISDDVIEILETAVKLAKGGDVSMIKFVLGDLLNEVRKNVVEEEDKADRGKITVTLKQYFGSTEPKPAPTTVEGEYTEVPGGHQ